MKRLGQIWFCLLLIGGWGCEEVPPPGLDLTPSQKGLVDTTYVADSTEAPQKKRVFIEEFTGVRCVNCPKGHKELHRLDSIHGDRLVVFSVHAGTFTEPYSYSDEDFSTQAGESIEDMVGPVSGYPAADVDRHLFSGETEVLIGSISNWSTYVEQRKQKTPPVNITLEDSFYTGSRKLEVQVTLHYTQSLSADHRLSVAIVENDIIDPQKTPSGVDTFYHHMHVLRDMLTAFNGEAITAKKEPGRVVKKGFRKDKLPEHWDVSNCHVVGFVHQSGDTLNVLQAAQTAIQ